VPVVEHSDRRGKSLAEHPVGLLTRLRFRVTVNTDNRLMSGCSLTSELTDLAHTFGYGWADLQWFHRERDEERVHQLRRALALNQRRDQPRYAELIG